MAAVRAREGYQWPIRCCMRTAYEISPARPLAIKEVLDMPEKTAIKKFLREYGSLGDAYRSRLLLAGFKEVPGPWTRPGVRVNDIAIFNGHGDSSIVMVNGLYHRPRSKLAMMAFCSEISGIGQRPVWLAWTRQGLERVSYLSCAYIECVLRWSE